MAGKLVIRSPNALRALLSTAIPSYDSAEIALLHIMKEYYFNTKMLQQILTEDHISVSFSEVLYEDIAPMVGLEFYRKMKDVETFHLHRSRIPTALFKSIVQNIDVMLMQYGPPIEHNTEMAGSQFLSPIFNHLIPLFGSAFRNLPDPIIKGHITTKSRVVWNFEAIGSIAVLFIEVWLETGSQTERLNAISQVIAECNACNWKNTQMDVCVPVQGILCDGATFDFFYFDGTTEPFTFKRGLDPNIPSAYSWALQLPNPSYKSTISSFIDVLRPVCETIFDLLLHGYVSSLKAWHKYFVTKNAREGQPQKSVEEWEEAISAAVKAWQGFKDAEMKRQAQLTNEANLIVEGAMAALKCSVDLIPTLYKPKLIMSVWDDVEIEKI